MLSGVIIAIVVVSSIGKKGYDTQSGVVPSLLAIYFIMIALSYREELIHPPQATGVIFIQPVYQQPGQYPAQINGAQPYPIQGQPYPMQGQPYPMQGQPYPMQGQPYVMQGAQSAPSGQPPQS